MSVAVDGVRPHVDAGTMGNEDNTRKRRKIALADLKDTKFDPLSSHGQGHGSSQTPGYDANAFKPGYMVNVKVYNFTTYAFAEFKLSPTLNMIIGPNGTGKSTLVAAICLGLGGRVDLIKRKTMKSMIKTGFNESTIKIELKNHDNLPNILVERTFTEKTSTWKINSTVSGEKSVKRLVKSFNIQLDNLCHFLPQERVAEFATLSPEKLLLETERTLGDGTLLHDHESLMSQDLERLELDSNIKKIEDRLHILTEESSALEEEVKKYQEYQEKSHELKLHKMLIPYGQIQDSKMQRKRLKEEKETAKRKIHEFEITARPLDDKLAEFENELAAQEHESSDFKSQNDTLVQEYTELQASVAKTEETIHDLKSKINKTKDRRADSKRQLEIEATERDNLVEKLNAIPHIDEDRLQDLSNTRSEKHDSLNDIRSELRELEGRLTRHRENLMRYQSNIKSKENRLNSNDKIEVLRSSNLRARKEQTERTYKALIHLRSKPQLKPFYEECPVVSCNVTDRRYAKYVEKVIDFNTLLSVFCPNEDAFNRIRGEVNNFRVPLRTTSENARRPPVAQNQLKDWGFDQYLSDFLNGPSSVLHCLNVQNYLNCIPVALNPLSDIAMSKLLTPDRNGRIPFMRFIADDTLFVVSRSKYGSQQYVYQTERVNEAQLFGHTGLSPQVREEITKEIDEAKTQMASEQEVYRKLQARSSDKKKAYEDIKLEFSAITAQQDNLRQQRVTKSKLEELIRAKETKIERMKELASKDYTDVIRLSERKVLQKYQDNANTIQECAKLVTKISSNFLSSKQHEFKTFESKNKVKNTKGLLQSLESHKAALQAAYEEASRKYSESKNTDAAKKLREQSATYTAEDRAALTELAADYLSKELLNEHHIRAKISLLEDERSVMSAADQSSIDSLKQKTIEIQQSEKDLPRLRRRKEDLDAQIATNQKRWESKLSKSVEKISKAFQKRFVKVASNGQVELVKDDRFKNWRLQILVKFRENSELKVLDHQSQSGGERAVSTIFFIMSLQGLTDAPFRVVDEINQGMDPKNEKMAHRYLVRTACQNNNSQYFLVTPKLLTGLYYHPRMAVHCIYTGTYLDSVDESSDQPDYLDMKRRKYDVE